MAEFNNQLYKRKAGESFNTKMNLFLFKKVIENDTTENDIEINIENESLGKFKDDFNKFNIDNETDTLKLYTAIYWQNENKDILYELAEEFNIDSIIIHEKNTINSIYNCIKKIKDSESFKEISENLLTSYIESFEKVFCKDDFKELLNNERCNYCNKKIDDFIKLADNLKIYKKNNRGWSLEIDRIDSNKEYTKDNCVMACYWCNNAKTDEFNDKEFEIIGKAIQTVWENRMNDKK